MLPFLRTQSAHLLWAATAIDRAKVFALLEGSALGGTARGDFALEDAVLTAQSVDFLLEIFDQNVLLVAIFVGGKTALENLNFAVPVLLAALLLDSH
ncbi:hypothetical protein HG530_001180 [Fusarium avenaceum]|nr:hypothetical protein HG530_001180 [Fusarium avenaceum]